MNENFSELRQDIVSGDWVVIATGRAKRPHDFLAKDGQELIQPKDRCPFEELFPDALSTYTLQENAGPDSDWWIQAVPNKYPAFNKGMCPSENNLGPYRWSRGIGYHEVVITQDHSRSLAEMTDRETELLIRAYQDRYLALKNEDCVKYISIFHNHGSRAGATLAHPHSQIIAIPVIPMDVGRSVNGSALYFNKNRSCVYCEVAKYELKTKKRIVYENDSIFVIAPFASKTAFELRVLPKKHEPNFETISAQERQSAGNALRVSLGKLFHGLNNPDYNFFLHTAPARDNKAFEHYHWHFEILPKTATWAGFEIGTGIEISTIAPEEAADFLKKINVK